MLIDFSIVRRFGMKKKTACFTGHRKIALGQRKIVAERLKNTVDSLISEGYRYFGVGGALGFDTLAAQCILYLKKQYPYESDFDSEYYDVDEDFTLGTCSLELPGNLPAGAPIQVTFTLNNEGILEVTGRDMTTNKEIHATMQATAGTTMSKEDVAAAKAKSKNIAVE